MNEEPQTHSLDPRDQQELEQLEQRLRSLQEHIKRLEGSNRDPYLDELGEHFHLGMVGGSGRGTGRLNRRKTQSLEKTIDTARALTPLYQQAARISAAIEDITSGRRQRKRVREEKRRTWLKEAQERVLRAEKGDHVFDQTYGRVEVLARNQKSLSIRTPGGRRETRKFARIIDVDRAGGG